MDGVESAGARAAPRHAVLSLLACPISPSELPDGHVDEPGLTIRAAQSWGERSAASLLIDRCYSRRGYHSPGPPDASADWHVTLVARLQGTLVGTLTIGFDSPERLLADELFPAEVQALRDEGYRLCEFTKLAMADLVRSQRVLAAMFHTAFIHARRLGGCDQLLIEVNPRHRRFYQAKLGFEVLGPVRTNRRVNAPALLLGLDLWQAQARVEQFGGRPDASREERTLYPYAFSRQEEAGILNRLRSHRPAEPGASSRAA